MSYAQQEEEELGWRWVAVWLSEASTTVGRINQLKKVRFVKCAVVAYR